MQGSINLKKKNGFRSVKHKDFLSLTSVLRTLATEAEDVDEVSGGRALPEGLKNIQYSTGS